MTYVIPKGVIAAALAAYRTASLNGGAAGIFINSIAPTPNTVLADLQEPGAEWPGYARQTIATWGPIYQGPSGPQCDAVVQIAGPTSGAGDDVVGWFLVDSGGALVASGRFDTALDGTVVGGAIVFVVQAKGILGGVVVTI